MYYNTVKTKNQVFLNILYKALRVCLRQHLSYGRARFAAAAAAGYVRARIPALRVGAPLSFWTEQDVLLPASSVGAWSLGGVIYFAESTAKSVISHAGMHGVRRR